MPRNWYLMIAYTLTILLSLTTITGSISTTSSLGNLDRCSGRLERALEALQRDSPRRNRLGDEEADMVYQQKLSSAPLEMIVSRLAVKLPQDSRNRGGLWAKVERCSYEPSSSALRTRVIFNDLAVSGVISLLPKDQRVPILGESCRMSLRLRRAGVEFHTNPIARGRGQMRIRTESSFLEPRFASIYAYGCRPARIDKQIKRHDKWPQTHHQFQQHQHQQATSSSSSSSSSSSPGGTSTINEESYEAAEPRGIVAGLTKEEDVTIANESARTREIPNFDENIGGVWRKNVWVTKIPRRERREARKLTTNADSLPESFDAYRITKTRKLPSPRKNSIVKKAPSGTSTMSVEKVGERIGDAGTENSSSAKNNPKRETTLYYYPIADRRREEREEFLENDFEQSSSSFVFENDDDLNPDEELEDTVTRDVDWQSREAISNEMEDIFLRGASQVLTRYIERELHPAIKETLMLSMGYTISYG